MNISIKKQLAYILVGVCILVLLGIIIGCDNGSGTKKDDIYDTRAIVCFGDSLTAGYGASNGQAYPDYLQKKIKSPVINAGISGDTTIGALARIDKDVLAKDPQVVIIEFGANDLWQGLTVTQIKNNLEQLIRRIDNGKRKIYIANWVPDNAITADFLTALNILRFANGVPALSMADLTGIASDFKSALIALTATANVELVENIFEGIYGKSSLMSDPIHPNARGYELMADKYFNAIKPYLQANNLLKSTTSP